jgi:TolB-like protein
MILEPSAEDSGRERQIKIIDFGLARGFGVEGLGTSVEAQTIGFRGTTQYASPEQCEEQRELDGRSDQYSLGCILWEMLTGAPPFQGRNHRELLNQHVSKPPTLERIAQLPAGVQALLTRMLAKDPADRYPDAASLVAALEHCRTRLASDVVNTVDAGGTTELPGAPKGNFNRRWWVRAAVAGAIVILVGVIWSSLRGREKPTAAAAPATQSSVTPPAAASRPPDAAAMPRKTIAVLPFENLSGRPDDAYLADGLQEEVLNALARLRDLKVISRTSVLEYRGKARNIKEIGERLGAGTILEGSVRRDGDKMRLNIQLIDARDDKHLLAANYDREVTNVLDLQSKVAKQVADALTATITLQDRGELDRAATNNGDAYDLYLRALALVGSKIYIGVDSVTEAKQLLEQAIALDSQFVDAYALLSSMYTERFMYHGEKPEDKDAARQALDKAFELDPQLPENKLARGIYLLYVARYPSQALPDFEQVAAARPNSSIAQERLGLALRRLGRADEALPYLARASSLDPLNRGYAVSLYGTLGGLRRYPEALQQIESYIRRFPNDENWYFFRACLQSRIQGDCAPLRVALRDYIGLHNSESKIFVEADIAQCEGRFADAAQLLSSSQDTLPTNLKYRVACLWHLAGNKELAQSLFRALVAEETALRGGKTSASSTEPLGHSRLAVVQLLLGEYDAAIATMNEAQAAIPESADMTNGPSISAWRAAILVLVGRKDEGYAEAKRLLHVPFGTPFGEPVPWFDPIFELVKVDPVLDELFNHPPRL